MNVVNNDRLTDFFTSKRFKNLNRRERKELEADRLARIGETSTNIKYADIIDNLPSIVENDPRFADVYIREKMTIFDRLNGGSLMLRSACQKVIDESFKRLTEAKTA